MNNHHEHPENTESKIARILCKHLEISDALALVDDLNTSGLRIVGMPNTNYAGRNKLFRLIKRIEFLEKLIGEESRTNRVAHMKSEASALKFMIGLFGIDVSTPEARENILPRRKEEDQ